MKTVIGIFVIVVATACVSNRERRQSVTRLDESVAHRHRDSVWSLRQQGAWTIDVVELEAWNRYTGWPAGCTDSLTANTDTPGRSSVSSGRYTAPTEGNYVRLSRFTLRSDSNTLSTGRFTDSAERSSASSNRKTVSTERKTFPSIGFTGWALLLIAVGLVVYRLVRSLFR